MAWFFIVIAVLLPFVNAGVEGYDIYQTHAAHRLIGLILGTLGLGRLSLEVLCKNSARFFVWWSKVVTYVTNPLGRWSVRVFFRDVGYDRHPRELLETVREMDSSSRLISSGPSSATFSFRHAIRFEVSAVPIAEEVLSDQHLEKENRVLNLYINPIELRFRDSKRRLNKEIIPLLEVLQEQLQPKKTNYEIEVYFDGPNPYFSAFLSSVSPKLVEEFNLSLDLGQPSTRQRSMKVHKERLEVFAPSVSSLKEITDDLVSVSSNIAVRSPNE